MRRSSPRIATRFSSTRKLFARVKTLYDGRDSLNLDPQSKRVLERYYNDVRAMPARSWRKADQAKLKELNKELSSLSTTFRKKNARGAAKAGALVIRQYRRTRGL